MKPFVKAAIRILKENWLGLLIFEITYRIISIVLLQKGSDFAIQICLNKLGYSYLTAENFGKFITYPPTIFFLVLGLLVMCFALTFEVSTLLYCFESSRRKQKTILPMIIYMGWKGTLRFLKKYPVRGLFYVIICTPYLCIHFLIWNVSQTKLLQFSLQQLGSSNYLQMTVLLVLLICASAVFSLRLPCYLMPEEDLKKFHNHTVRSGKARWIKVLSGSVAVQIFAVLIAFILYMAALMIMVVCVTTLKAAGTMVSAVLFYSRLIQYAAGVAAGSAGIMLTLLYFYICFAESEMVEKQEPRSLGSEKKSAFARVMSSKFMLYGITVFIVLAESAYLLGAIRRNLPDMGPSRAAVAVTAHRGGARMAPENTLSAMAYAVEAMADMAEIDVQETKDGEIVLLHDTNLKRTTGFSANIWNITSDQINQLDAGVKFNKKFLGEPVPTLEQVIRFCKGKMKLNIEVKYNGHNKGIVKKVVKIIEDEDFTRDCVITSMNYKFLKQVKQENPDIKTGYTLRMSYGDLSELSDADFFSVKHTYITGQFVKDVHKMGKEVHAWTLNYQGDMQRMLSMNVDNIITDDPELVRKVILGETDRNPTFLTLLKYALQ
ncbi:glycerophosphodiester phosphodiesterase [Novisyntrophococcus fermenticellae]|uniref:glycerophosphodiester phosphodiesterase n=1 Tax=Novisyntrophococcus fermenticellae TaxID=2068655 RepID=UPI001E4AA0ED|nr:glycerophosphodiester phosphodiesterase [Novisyntrophococcus fermenticellae]